MSAAALMLGSSGTLVRLDTGTTTGVTVTVTREASGSGDFQLALMGLNNNGAETWTGDTGWTEDVDQNAGVDLRVAHIASSGATTSWAFTSTNGIKSKFATVLTFRNASYDTIGAIASTAVGASITPGGITVASANSLLLMLCVSKGAAAFTIPTGMTLLAQDTTSTPSWAVFSERVGSGATGATRSTTGGATDNAAVLVSLTLT